MHNFFKQVGIFSLGLIMAQSVMAADQWTDYFVLDRLRTGDAGNILVFPNITTINPAGCNNASFYYVEHSNVARDVHLSFLLPAYQAEDNVRFAYFGKHMCIRFS